LNCNGIAEKQSAVLEISSPSFASFPSFAFEAPVAFSRSYAPFVVFISAASAISAVEKATRGFFVPFLVRFWRLSRPS
jgi:hypothetical protein